MLKQFTNLLLFSAAAIASTQAVQAQNFELTLLSDFDGGFFDSFASSVSADGKVVGGHGFDATGYKAFSWTKETGLVNLGVLSGGFQSIASGVSGDGSTIVGLGINPGTLNGFKSSASGLEALPDLSGSYYNSFANAISNDASTIVGSSLVSDSSLGSDDSSEYEAVRWTSSGVEGLGDLAGGNYDSSANSVSGDGSVIAGGSDSALGYQAFKWTEDAGMVGLGDLAGGDFYSDAKGVIDSGEIIVGESHSENGYEAFRWDETNGMLGLGDLAGGDFDSSASDISADGSMIVGDGTSEKGDEAVFWHSESDWEPISLNDLLDINGFDRGDFILRGISAVSSDGNTFVGYGTHDNGDVEAYVLNHNIVPEPSTNILIGLAFMMTFVFYHKRIQKSL